MFENFLAVPLHFSIEFLGFLVAVGGALLGLTRADFIRGPASNRYSVALGFGVLALAQVLHGGAFLADDADRTLLALRALGYASILIGIVGGLRPGAAAVFGFRMEQPLTLAPAGAALLVALAAFSAGSRDDARGTRRLAFGMLFISLSEVALAAADPSRLVGNGEFDRYAYASHGLRTIGVLAVASWMWVAVRGSIRIRYVASFGALLVTVVLVLSTALSGVISNSVVEGELDRIQAQASAAAKALTEAETADLTRGLQQIVPTEVVVKAMAAGNKPADLAVDIGRVEVLDTDFVIVDPKKTLPGFEGRGPFLRKPGRRDPELTAGLRAGLLGTQLFNEVVEDGVLESSGIERVRELRGDQREFVAVLAVARVMDGRRYLGAIAIGRWVDFLVMEGIAAPLDANASLVLDNDTVVASDLPKALRADIVVPSEQEGRLSLTGGAATQLRLGPDNYFTGYAQISNGGIDVATLVITSEATVIAGTRNAVNRLLFAAAMLVGAIALGLAWVSGRRITRPIQELTATARLVREGDLSAQAPVIGEDEVGQLGETFNEMTASLLRMTENLRLAAREESALRARIETIIQSMADGLVAVDAEMNVLAYNREAEHLTGVPAEQAIGRPVSEILVARDGQGTEVPLPIHSLAEGSMAGVFLDSRDKAGIPVAITSAVLKGDDDLISAAVAVIRDTTREREIERMKTEFLSNISHELRTPLTPIKGYAEILGRKPVSREKQLQFVGGILDSTSRLERIVELLVDFAAMEAGRMAPRSSQVDMASILNDLSDRWKKRAPKHRLLTELPPALPVIVGDERLLRRSLEEVLDNAIKFSPNGGTITLSAKTVPSNGASGSPRLEVTITDEGIGINPDDLPQIFSDFRQLDGSETRTYGGLGLGLAFVRRIAQAHDGDVRVESVPEKGTSFTIQLPCLEYPEGVPGD